MRPPHYLLSVLLYYLSAAGTSLGSYQFLQDSSFLPGNVANIAMLWGLLYWIENQTWKSAPAFALAALFHLNYTLIALIFWPTSHLLAGGLARRGQPRPVRTILLPYLLILLASLPPFSPPSAPSSPAPPPRCPLDDFVNLYVHLRHPHHYDPLTWPLALWLSFLWPIPLAVLVYRRQPRSDTLRRAAFAFLFFITLLAIAFLFAGVFFVSEPLIQMSLFRFSIYPKLLACIGAAAFLLNPALPRRRTVRWALASLSLLLIAGLLLYRALRPALPRLAIPLRQPRPADRLLRPRRHQPPLSPSPKPPARPARPRTLHPARDLPPPPRPADRPGGRRRPQLPRSLSLGPQPHAGGRPFHRPPNEQLFRYHAQRAIVVNFKNVPQLSSEMPEWQSRLETLLDQPPLHPPQPFRSRPHRPGRPIRRPFRRTPHHRRPPLRPPIHSDHPPPPTPQPLFENNRYHLYDLASIRRTTRMNPTQLQQHLRETQNLRIGEETARYIATRLTAPLTDPTPFPIFAQDARTGHPLQPTLNPADFLIA